LLNLNASDPFQQTACGNTSGLFSSYISSRGFWKPGPVVMMEWQNNKTVLKHQPVSTNDKVPFLK